MELTKEKYFSICKESGFWRAKNYPGVNQNNFYVPIEMPPCFIQQLDALAFSWFEGKCYSHYSRFQYDKEVITTVEELQNEIERCKKMYELNCKKATKKMVAVKKKAIQNCTEGFEV